MDDMGGGYRGRGRGGRGGRGRFSGRGGREGRGGRGERRPDPQPCPITTDEHGQLKIKITCLIMRDFAGAVIGRGGEHVTDIRKESGALIHVCKPDMVSGIQGVDLFGTLQQVGAAQAKLSNILAENAGDWCEDSKWGARVRFFLLPDMASIVIGKKGSTVQRIIKESNAGVRVSNESDENNLQSCQIFGTNSEAASAFALLVEVLADYGSADSKTIPRLKEAWEQRRSAEMYGGPDAGYAAGGPSPDRGRYAYGPSSDSRYEPYPRSGRNMHGGGGGDEVNTNNMVVMPNAVQVPNIPGGMPTVLIQQADGSLVQAQVVTQAGGQYTVQPATAPQGAVQQLKTQYNTGAPLSTSASGSVGPQQPQQAVGGVGQMLIPGPGGVMYTTAPADGSAQGGMQQGAPQMSYSSVGSGMQASSGVPGGQGYQVAPAGGVQMASGSVAAQPQAADPMAYAKLAGYGQQGVSKAVPSAQYSVAAAGGGPMYAPTASAPMSNVSYGQGGIYSAPVGGSQYAAGGNSQYTTQGK